MKKIVKLSQVEIEHYTFLLDKLMALRTLKIIVKEGNFTIDNRRVSHDYIDATENIRIWWDNIMKEHDIIDNGKKKSIDYQKNIIIFDT